MGIAAAILLICAIVILFGRGDWLLSGYNTASEEKRAQYNIVRLRAVTGIGLIVLALEIVAFQLTAASEAVSSSVILATALIMALLQYTYCRR